MIAFSSAQVRSRFAGSWASTRQKLFTKSVPRVSRMSANTAAANSSAYSSGYAAGSANTAAAYAMGVNYAALPAGAMAVQKYGNTYYLVGNTWFQPAYGANGVYYRVVPTP